MKRVLLFILALALLTGCTGAPNETTPSTGETIPAPGIYVPGHVLETQSGGAVRVFPLDESCNDIAFQGKTLLTFSAKDNGTTVVTPFAGLNLTQQEAVTLGNTVLPGDKTIRLEGSRTGYYNREENCIVFLDSGFQETGRAELPRDMIGEPVLSENMGTVFYCTGDEVRALSVESGINRLIRKQSCQALSVEAVLFADSVLMCRITDNDGNTYTEFLSSQTGEPMGIDRSFVSLDIWENRYFLKRLDWLVMEYIFTAADGSQQCFHPEGVNTVYSLLPINSVATVTEEAGGVRLEMFDLSDGKRKSELQLSGVEQVHSLISDPEQSLIWFLCQEGETGKQLLCSWNLEKSAVSDNQVYITPRYTAEKPDVPGMAACRAKADDLEQRFGVEIHLADEPQEGKDYALTYEHHPEVFLNALDQLEKAMSVFPEGFLETVADVSDSMKLHIGLVRNLKAKHTGVPNGIVAHQYWVDGNAWIALSVGNNVEQLFYHELAHVLDTFVYSKNVGYDEWVKLNPKDFSYDLSYNEYEARGESPYLSGKNRVFIDSYSMTFPKEDRARIFDCAITEGNAELFASETMQSKLRQFCVGLRNACGWKKDERSFLWEQYLETPLAYTKK